MNTARSEDPKTYATTRGDDQIIAEALEVLRRRVMGRKVIACPSDLKNYLVLRAANLEREEFAVVFLDGQHGIMTIETMFQGTLTQTSVYPREVARRALMVNAAAVILTHNHPSGQPEPSRADEHLTQNIKQTLSLVDVRVLDHVVTGAGCAVSMAERGLI